MSDLRSGELWQHNKNHRVVRIEAFKPGLLSFSVSCDKRWVMYPFPWDEADFTQKFTRLNVWVTTTKPRAILARLERALKVYNRMRAHRIAAGLTPEALGRNRWR